MATCTACGCTATTHAAAHAIVAALAMDDLDAAIEAGLLDAEPCPTCAPACRGALQRARAERLRALAARERHRARDARLSRAAELRAAMRGPAPQAAPTALPGMDKDAKSDVGPAIDARPSALPPAAAAALARARARAAGRAPR